MRSARAAITLVKMRPAVRNIILALMLAIAVTTVLPEEDLEIFDGCNADTYSVPTRQRISLFHQVNNIIISYHNTYQSKVKSHAKFAIKFLITLRVLTKNNKSGVSSHKFKTKIHLTCSHNTVFADTDLQHFILHSCQYKIIRNPLVMKSFIHRSMTSETSSNPLSSQYNSSQADMMCRGTWMEI